MGRRNMDRQIIRRYWDIHDELAEGYVQMKEPQITAAIILLAAIIQER